MSRPRWSLQASFWMMLVIGAVVALIVIFGMKKSIWVELEIILGILSMCLFVFLFAVLYEGVTFDRNESLDVSWKSGKLENWGDWSGADTWGGWIDGVGDDPLGCVLGLAINLLISVLLALLIPVILWLGFGAIITAVVIIAVPLFFMFRRILRSAVVRGRRSRGRVGAAAMAVLSCTVTNMFWVYLILGGGHALSRYLERL